ncbi:MAG: aminotransferase class I/II-fold pyridoxal phosphate-dependent enzyme [Ignavibacteriae bacterium]|nr:aminotransferase class I/II-fold pyridoxal phosphate-dependent enzyme [Ignavibacteriota bacterium]MCB9216922.1 aminotransferase class I/II-fold pyridoxal phosphate-dependent enzyme [Ignavibacteria bacterium]
MIVDLRSDTVTKPTPEMREAMARAEVGDDVYGEDPTVSRLEERVAEITGKDRGLFVPTGVMGNQLCLKSLTQPGDEVILGEESHIFNYETAAPSLLSGIQVHTVEDSGGCLDPEQVEKAIREEAYYLPRTSVIAQEQTHNRKGGKVIPVNHIEKINSIARTHGIASHLDGARLWNAVAATGVTPATYCQSFDTASLCFSKGLGTPVGSVIVGSSLSIEIAHRFRKIWGGGWRQAGILAAACLYALDNHVERLKEDQAKAVRFHELISDIEGVDAGDIPDSNIVVFRVPRKDLNHLVKEVAIEEVLISSAFKGALRVVFHMDVSLEQTESAAQVLAEVLKREERD